MGTVSVLKTDIKGGRLPHSIRKREGICGKHSPIYIKGVNLQDMSLNKNTNKKHRKSLKTTKRFSFA